MVAALVWMAGVAMAWGQDYVDILAADEQYNRGSSIWRDAEDLWDLDETTYWQLEKSDEDKTPSAPNYTDYSSVPNNRVVFSFESIEEIKKITVVAKEEENTRPTSIVVKVRRDGSSGESDWKQIGEYDFSGERTDVKVSLDGYSGYTNILLTFKNNNSGSGTTNINEVYFLTSSYKKGNHYNDNYKNQLIYHKRAKWYDIRKNSSMSQDEKDMDSFDDDLPLFETDNGEMIQAAHTYIDTIYVLPESRTRLILPDMMSEGSLNSKSYQRWYSYRTGKTFEIPSENRTNDVYDLLTPINVTPYRYSNGYIGSPLTDPFYQADFYFPSDDEFKTWFANSERVDNSWYVVACDVSIYNDYADNYTEGGTEFDKNNPHEPTLSHRIIYYICSAERPDGMSAEQDPNWYRRAINSKDYQGGNKYLEEYDIEFPMVRVSNNTFDLVALSKDARAYAIPGQTGNEVLNIELVDGEGNKASGIQLVTTTVNDDDGKQMEFKKKGKSNTISGKTRAIQFAYPTNNSNSDGTLQTLNSNSEATILVTKTVNGTTYNIAKFNLTFKPDTRLLTQSQIKELKEEDDLYKRTPAYLKKNYELLTELDWDYDADVADVSKYGQDNYYPFPMAWDYSSYGFFDGATKDDIVSGQNTYTEWGYYSIQKHFTETSWGGTNKPKSEPLDGSTYHLYVDASDRPGIIARLPFEEALCEGSELFVSAWVKNCVWENTKYPSDAGMLFTIMGVRTVGETTTYTPIYRHNTGQIREADLLKSGSGLEQRSVTVSCAEGVNEWYQVYFTFTTQANQNYDSYILQIDNSSLSTNGGDMYLDEVQIYIATPEAQVEQKAPTCGEETLLKLRTNFEPLMSRTEDEAGWDTNGWRYVNFCFVDSLKYVEALKGNTNPDADAVQAAIQAARVEFAYPTDQNGGKTKYFEYGRLEFNTDFTKNQKYNEAKNAVNIQASDIGQEGAFSSKFYYIENSENLAVDIYAKLEPFRKYFFALVIPNTSGEPDVSAFTQNLLEPCAITSGFSVESETVIKVSGNVLTEDMDFCKGQVVDFSVQLQGNVGSGDLETITQRVYYDWVYVSYTEFIQSQEGTTLKDAIKEFRAEYPNATTLQPAKDDFTPEMYQLLETYKDKITLYRTNLNVRLAEEGEFNMVVCPCPVNLEGIIICTEPVPVTLMVTGNAPEANVGFDGLSSYPTNAIVRIGLDEHINQIKENSPLTIPLRGVALIDNITGSDDKLSVSPDYPYVYLISSDDPIILDINDRLEDGLRSTDLPIGIITNFAAQKGGENQVIFYFDKNLTKGEGVQDLLPKDFNFREGYRYTLLIPFYQTISGSAATNLCEGTLVFNMYVVPKYQRWIGGPTSNWNKDENWVRSNADELNNPNNYKTYTDATRRGFVPMDFTKITIPTEAGKIRLYRNGNANKPTEHGQLDLETTEVSEPATSQIQYDLLVKKSTEGGYECESYYTNTVEQIHFEPNTEMLHAELLDYKKAWVDYELTKGRWYTLASPLQGVVAGDFYTDESGTEESPYFEKIEFNEDDNSRVEPAVYQRGWKPQDATLQTVSNGTKETAISGNWSSVYNKVDEAYTPGTGFSLKVLGENTEKVLFRLAKDDGSYTYYNYSNGNLTAGSHKEENLPRTNAGLLESNTLKNGSITETLQAANGSSQYYLVGNPFMAHLKASAFFETNKDVLEQKYWLVQDDNQDVAVGGETESDWVFVDAQSTALIAPLQSFFVQKKKDAAGDVTFTKDMQVLGDTDDNLRSTDVLYLTATTQDGRQSRAAISYDPAASETYEASEDAELFLDSNLGDLPMVYTAAGTMAASINRTSGLYNIPVGVYAPGAKSETVSLTFSGVDGFSYATLYDAETRTESPIHEGSRFTVPANTAGRYFLRAGVPTANEAVQESAIRIYTVGGGTLVVASTDLLRTVRVYDFAGRLVASETGLRTTQCRIELPEGSYIVKAESERGEEEVKLRM